MKNPFTRLVQKTVDFFDRRKKNAVVYKQSGTKVEIARNSGGGSSVKTPKVTDSNNPSLGRSNKGTRRKRILVAKRRLANKVARRSRRINRLKRNLSWQQQLKLNKLNV